MKKNKMKTGKKKSFKWLWGNWDKLILALMVGVYVVLFSYLSIRRHNAFFSGYDLANMDQVIWNSLHGRLFSLTSGELGTVSRLQFHADFILVLLAPLYLLWDNVRALLVFQSLALGLGAIPLYLIGKLVLKDKLLALGVVGLYLLNPGMQWTNMYDFHGVALAIPLLLGAFWAGISKKWRVFILFSFLAVLTKEEVSLLVAAMAGLFFLWSRKGKERKLNLLVGLGGVLWFGGIIFWLMPKFSVAGQHWAWEWFDGVGLGKTGKFEVSGFGFLLPRLREEKLYYRELLEPFGYLPLLGLPWLLLGLPEFVINMFSNQGQMRGVVMHYDSGLVPALAIASVFALFYLKRFLQFLKIKWGSIVLLGLLLLAGVMGAKRAYFYSPTPVTPGHWRAMYQVGETEREFEKLLQSLPKDASIASSSEIRPHINHREFSYNLPAGEEADYVAMLDKNRLVGDVNIKPYEKVLIEKLEVSEDYEKLYDENGFYLFKRNR